jgi:hypothetical protein
MVLAVVLALVLLLDLDSAADTGRGSADEIEMIVDVSSVIFPLGYFSRSNQNRGSGAQSSKTIQAAMSPADRKSPKVKNQTMATRGLVSEAPENLDRFVMWFPGGWSKRCCNESLDRWAVRPRHPMEANESISANLSAVFYGSLGCGDIKWGKDVRNHHDVTNRAALASM